MTAAATQAWYVYGVVPHAAAAPAVGAVLPGARIEALALGQLTVLVSLVPSALFDGRDAGNRTADPDWMAARLTAHHGVNAAASAAGACLPLAFGAVFSSLERLRAWLLPREAALLAALAQVGRQSEWALSLLEEAPRHAMWLDGHVPGLGELVLTLAQAGEGTAFLMARRLDKARAAARSAHLSAVADVVAAGLTAAGLTVAAEPPRDGLPAWTIWAARAGGDGEPVAGLIAPLADELAPQGLGLRLSGPWPPYAFARAVMTEEACCG